MSRPRSASDCFISAWSIRPEGRGKKSQKPSYIFSLRSFWSIVKKLKILLTIVVFVQTLEGEFQLLLVLLQVLAELAEVEPFVLIFVTGGNYFLGRRSILAHSSSSSSSSVSWWQNYRDIPSPPYLRYQPSFTFEFYFQFLLRMFLLIRADVTAQNSARSLIGSIAGLFKQPRRDQR